MLCIYGEEGRRARPRPPVTSSTTLAFTAPSGTGRDTVSMGLGPACDDEVVALLEALIREKTPGAVLFSATQAGKDYAPRLAPEALRAAHAQAPGHDDLGPFQIHRFGDLGDQLHHPWRMWASWGTPSPSCR